MPKKCCIPNCRLQGDDPGCLKLNFFQVPKNEDRRKAWSESINNYFNKEVEFKKFSYVCALHFEPQFFHYGGLCQVLRLTKDSCPTIFENYPSIKHQVHCTQQDGRVQNSTVVSNKDSLSNSKVEIIPSMLCTVHLSSSMDQQHMQNNLISIKEDSHSSNNARPSDIDTYTVESISVESDYESDERGPEKNKVNERSAHLNSSALQDVLLTSIPNKSLANINLDSIDYKNKNMVRQILENAQKEIKTLRQTRRNQAMRLYRARKRMKNSSSLTSHTKQRKLIPKKVSKTLTKSAED